MRLVFLFFLSTFSLLIPPSFASTKISINDIKWPPFFFPNVEHGVQGIGKEILAKCIDNQRYELHFKHLPIKRTHLYMQSGELDISIYSYQQQRENFVIYGKEPIFTTNYGFVSRKSDNLSINQISDIKSLNFGHLAGLSHTPELMTLINEKKKRNEVSMGYDIDSMFGQLLATPQRFQVMANSLETFHWRAKQLNIQEQIKVHDIIIKNKAYYVTVSKASNAIADHHEFLNNIDQCIKALKQSDEYYVLKAKYGL